MVTEPEASDMLSETEKQCFEEVCLDHIWRALGTHSMTASAGAELEAHSVAMSVRQLVDAAPIYRNCWERVRPIVRTQGFRSFIEIVDGARNETDIADYGT